MKQVKIALTWVFQVKLVFDPLKAIPAAYKDIEF